MTHLSVPTGAADDPAGRRRGQTLKITALNQKLELALLHATKPDGQRRYPTRRKFAEALDIDPTDLAHVMHKNQLSSARVPALLRLFDLDPGDWVVPVSKAEQDWVTFAQEPLDVFRARVRLAGGDDHTNVCGRTWDRFLADLRAQCRCTPANPANFRIVARDPDEWRQPHRPRVERMGPIDDDGLGHRAATGLPVLHAGQWARIFLDTRSALPQRKVEARGAHVFMFQDVFIDGRRRIAALLPFPKKGNGLVMPSDFVGGSTGVDPELQIPLPEGEQQFLQIYPDWGAQRSLVAVISEHMLDDEVVCESRDHREIQVERLDLLAGRLANRRDSSFAVWELRYKVV